MKPEHFIYKSNDLYYMQNVPEEPNTIGIPSELYQDYIEPYEQALERAKAEAVKVESLDDREAIGYLILLKYNETKEGEIYTINMKEKIEVVCDGRCKGIKCTIGKVCDGDSSHNCLDKVARIVAPKKEEESESQMLREILHNYSEHLRDRKHGSLKPLESFMAEELEKFEIKRKPL